MVVGLVTPLGPWAVAPVPGCGVTQSPCRPDSVRQPRFAAASVAVLALVNTGSLAAAVESNPTYDKPSGATGGDDARFWHQARKADDGSVRGGCGPAGGPTAARARRRRRAGRTCPGRRASSRPTPTATRPSTGRTAPWPSGPSVSRPRRSEDTANRVVAHIPFNFASQATHPFLRTFDTSTGSPSPRTASAGSPCSRATARRATTQPTPTTAATNKRAGGLKDLNALLKGGRKWGATLGVHVNATEAYPEANAFDEELVDTTAPGWNWLNQSYYLDHRRRRRQRPRRPGRRPLPLRRLTGRAGGRHPDPVPSLCHSGVRAYPSPVPPRRGARTAVCPTALNGFVGARQRNSPMSWRMGCIAPGFCQEPPGNGAGDCSESTAGFPRSAS